MLKVDPKWEKHYKKRRGTKPYSLNLVIEKPRMLEWRGEEGKYYIVVTYINKMLYVGISERELKADVYGVPLATGEKYHYTLTEILNFLGWKEPVKPCIEY